MYSFLILIFSSYYARVAINSINVTQAVLHMLLYKTKCKKTYYLPHSNLNINLSI